MAVAAPPDPLRTWAHPRAPRRSMLWLVVSANASVLLVALVLLASTPFTVTWPTDVREGVVLVVAVGVTLGVQVLLLRRVLAPLGALWQHMHTVDPLRPGERIDVRARSVEVSDLVLAFNAMLDRLEQERRESARRAQAAQEAERRWLSLELHDQIGQELTALLLGIDLARRVDDERRDETLATALQTATDCLERVRSIAHTLRPAGLDELGLPSALLNLGDRVARSSGLRVERRFGELPLLTADAQLTVFRVAQESLANVTRHAGASWAELSLTPRGGGVRLVVADDGAGGAGVASDAEGSGIRGMRERALMLGASLEVRPRSPRGTEVVLDVPATEVIREGDPGG